MSDPRLVIAKLAGRASSTRRTLVQPVSGNSEIDVKMNEAVRPENDLFVHLRSSILSGTTIGVCVGGGIAAIEVPKIVRELRRLGAKVKIYATESALKFIGKDALEWASTQTVTIHASGLAEHIALEDAVLVIPATADLIGKAANGICTDACSTYIQSALGRGLLTAFMPTMHESLRNAPAVSRNIALLSESGSACFLDPRIEEGKLKCPPAEMIALELAYRIKKNERATHERRTEIRALVTFGGTSVPIDSARSITNQSTGTLGTVVIQKLLENGVQVTALCGVHRTTLPTCSGLTLIKSESYAEMSSNFKKLLNEGLFDAVFHLAAISDFGTKQVDEGKISSSAVDISLELLALPKLIADPEFSNVPYKVACKYTASDSPDERNKATDLLKKYAVDFVLWNWGSNAFGENSGTENLLIGKEGPELSLPNKNAIAELLVQNFVESIESRNN